MEQCFHVNIDSVNKLFFFYCLVKYRRGHNRNSSTAPVQGEMSLRGIVIFMVDGQYLEICLKLLICRDLTDETDKSRSSHSSR